MQIYFDKLQPYIFKKNFKNIFFNNTKFIAGFE